jgi:hypothetical protein
MALREKVKPSHLNNWWSGNYNDNCGDSSVGMSAPMKKKKEGSTPILSLRLWWPRKIITGMSSVSMPLSNSRRIKYVAVDVKVKH